MEVGKIFPNIYIFFSFCYLIYLPTWTFGKFSKRDSTGFLLSAKS